MNTPGHPTRTFTVLAIAAASFTMLQSLVSPVLPTIQRDLHTTAAAVSWILIAWLLSAAVATPILGRIGDLMGKKRTLIIALAAIVAGSLLAAAAPSITLVIAGRIIQGLGGAVFPLAFGILRDELPAARVPTYVGILSGVIAAGGGLGTVLAGPIVDLASWRGLFWIPALVVTATAIIAHRLIPASPIHTTGRINISAAALLAGWLVALLLPLTQGSAWGWTSPAVLTLLVAAAALFTAWIMTETRARHALIDLRMMRLPAVWTTNLVALLFGAAMFSMNAFLPQFVQMPLTTGYGFGASVTGAGLLMLPLLATMAVSGTLSGALARHLNFKAQLTTGSALTALACIALALAHTTVWEVALAGGVFGLGLGLAYAASTSLIVQSVSPAQTGAASGMSTNIRTIGGAIGTAVISTVIYAHPQVGGLPSADGFTHGFLVIAGLAVLATAGSFLVPTARRAHYSTLGQDVPTAITAEAQ